MGISQRAYCPAYRLDSRQAERDYYRQARDFVMKRRWIWRMCSGWRRNSGLICKRRTISAHARKSFQLEKATCLLKPLSVSGQRQIWEVFPQEFDDFRDNFRLFMSHHELMRAEFDNVFREKVGKFQARSRVALF